MKDSLIKDVLQECGELYSANKQLQLTAETIKESSTDNVDSSLVVPLFIFDQSILRNIKILKTYVDYRANKITKTRFEIGALPLLPEEMKDKLSKNEKEFLKEYNNLIDQYINIAGVDITSNIVPPKGLLLEVKALVDAGEIFTESSGAIELQIGKTYLLRGTDAEILIKQGLVEQVSL